MRAVAVAAVLMMTLSPIAALGNTSLRVASFNASLFFSKTGELVESLRPGDLERARKVAAVIQRVRPDVLLLNEFDHDAEGAGCEIFLTSYLEKGQFGEQPIDYPYRYSAPVNTGVSSGVDLNGDGQVNLPGDAFGFGRYPGQYGMLVLSRYPIEMGKVRTFQNFLWRDMPEAWWPMTPDNGEHFYTAEAREVFRLSSKSHWDLPIQIAGNTLHFLVSHPTPPVFDGPEDRNGRRNHDEIRFWRDYVDGADYPVDDAGVRGGLAPDARFVIAGDLNADPNDGDSSGNPIALLLTHPRINDQNPPSSKGAREAAQSAGGVNENHTGPSRHDTADFNDEVVGNMRIDYVLPSTNLKHLDAGVFWPAVNEPGHAWLDATDHHLVWVDLAFEL